MNRFKLYNLILLSLVGSLFVSVLGMAFYMEPESGELTRMGGYLENDFGWNVPQDQFVSPLFKKAASLVEFDRYYDVVVLGDSFSDDLLRGWQNHLVSETGWSLISFNMNWISLEQLLKSDTYRTTPPKLFIYETIERNTIIRHRRCTRDENSVPLEAKIEALSMQKIEAPTIRRERKARSSRWTSLDLDLAVNFWFKTLGRAVLPFNTTEVHKFQLNKGGLFSSTDNSNLLVITRDFNLQGVSSEQIKTAQCRLLEIQDEIQRTGRTAFLALIFPDKTSVYAEFIRDDEYSDLSVLSEFESTQGLNIAKLKSSFEDAVGGGAVDLYLPNDTHCGFYGYGLAAQAVLEAVAEKRWIGKEYLE